MRSEGRYVQLGPQGVHSRARALESLQTPCVLCPRECRALRSTGEHGFCHAGTTAIISSWGLHFGEESVLVGRGGSGTIFVGGCNLGCVFCQNYSISHLGEGRPMESNQIAGIMLDLQRQGAENINWVTPTHQVPQLVQALAIASERGLTIPLVYNCGGYESERAIALLDGVVDIYLPDAKFSDAEAATSYCDAPDYFARACRAIRRMFRQVGTLVEDDRGVATGGLLVRHLVMPGGRAGSAAWARALGRITERSGFVNVMAQYRPAYRASFFPEISRPVFIQEVVAAREQFSGHVHRVE